MVDRDHSTLARLLAALPPTTRYAGKYTHPINARDVHGMTPLHLAVILADEVAVETLIEAGASVTVLTPSPRYAPYHEAIATSNVSLFLRMLLIVKATTHEVYAAKFPHVLDSLASLPDFSMEIDWKVSSWIPLLSRVCPSDTYKITKVGQSLRVDLTLLGRDGRSWLRGDVSYLFHPTAPLGVLYRIDHQDRSFSIVPTDAVKMTDQEIAVEAEKLMRGNIKVTDLPLHSISFQPATSWSGTPKTAEIGDYTCTVVETHGMVVTTVTRDEHLSSELKAQMEARQAAREERKRKRRRGLDPSSDGDGGENGEGGGGGWDQELAASLPPYTPVPYSDATSFKAYTREGPDILRGRPVHAKTQTKGLKPMLWCSHEFPLTIDQFRPMLMLLAPASPEFAQIEQFFENELPHQHGFPVRFQLPLYRVFKAEATHQAFRLIDPRDPDVFAAMSIPPDYVYVERLGYDDPTGGSSDSSDDGSGDRSSSDGDGVSSSPIHTASGCDDHSSDTWSFS